MCNIVFHALLFLTIKHVAYRVIIINALADKVVGRVPDPWHVLITTAVLWSCGPLVGVDNKGGEWEVWDEALDRQLSSRAVVLPLGQHFRTDV